MPHKHTVLYKDENVTLEYGVELLQEGVVLYRSVPKILHGWGRFG